MSRTIRFCPFCGESVDPKFNFCPQCGQGLPKLASSPQTPYASTTPANTEPTSTNDSSTSTSDQRQGKRSLNASQPLLSSFKRQIQSLKDSKLYRNSLKLRRRCTDYAPIFDPTAPLPITTPLTFGVGNRKLNLNYSIALEIVLLTAITAIAFWLRYDGIEVLPPGIHGDEANFGLDALSFINGENRGFWTGSNLGNPAGYAWLLAIFFTIGEANVEWLRISSVIAGTALIPIVYLLIRTTLNRELALIVALFLATSTWLIIQSRLGFPMMFSVTLLFAALYLLVEGVKRDNLPLAILGGLIFGAGLYSFKAFTVFFVAVIPITLLLILLPKLAKSRRVLLTFSIVALIIALPLLRFYIASDYLVTNYNDYYNSYDDINYLNFIPTLLMQLPTRFTEHLLLSTNFVYMKSGTDGIQSVPLLDFATQFVFWMGLVTSLIYIKRPAIQIILIGFMIAMLPSIISPGLESRRYLAAIVFVIILSSIGIRTLFILGWMFARMFAIELGSRYNEGISLYVNKVMHIAFATLLVLIICVSHVNYNTRLFNDWASNKGGLAWFQSVDLIDAWKFVDSLQEPHFVEFYAHRWPLHYHPKDFLDLTAVGRDGSREFGGDGQLPDQLNGELPTVFILFGDYMQLADELEQRFPNGTRTNRYGNSDSDPEDELFYVVYIVDDWSIDTFLQDINDNIDQ